jgi:hypothetical protein
VGLCLLESRLTRVDCNYERPRYDDFKNYKTEALLYCRTTKKRGSGGSTVQRIVNTRGFITPLELTLTPFPLTKAAAVLSLLKIIKDDDTFEEWAVLLDANDRGMLDPQQAMEASHRCNEQGYAC